MNYEFKKVLVTGGAGCIGLQVCRELLKRGIEPVILDLGEQINVIKEQLDSFKIFYGSILDYSTIREAINGCDAVIHLAAYLGVRRTEINKLRCLEINIEGTKNVLEASVSYGIDKIVFASSSEVYGEPISNPITEKDITQGKTVYAASKIAGEELVKAYHESFKNLNFTILRYFNTYGPNQVAQFVIPKFINNVMNDISPEVYGDGSQLRGYTFSKDTAIATVDSLFSKETNGNVLNIGNSDNFIDLIALANLIISICKKEDTIKVKINNNFINSDRDQSREIFKRYCSTEKAKRMINFSPKISLEEGIRSIIDNGPIESEWATSEKEYSIIKTD